LSDHTFGLKKYMIDARNGDVTRSLIETYKNCETSASATATRDIKVFCVSNRLYWDMRDDPKDVSLPSLHLSGIIDLRRYCISIVSTRKLEAALVYINEEVPALLASIQLWVQSGAGTMDAERKAAVRDALGRIERHLTTVSPLHVLANAGVSADGTKELTFPDSVITNLVTRSLDSFRTNISQSKPA
jgi:hypothetical protein